MHPVLRGFLRPLAMLLLAASLSACTTADTLGIAKVPPPQAPLTEKFAAIVIDAKTGKTLYEREPDATRYPASLAKMMTAYLLFDALKSGRTSLGAMIPVSEHAASRPPSKLGLKAGDTIAVDAAIRALTVKSANDVASAVAEFLGGTEDNFATLMTAKARTLGMNGTRFTNASGLPDPNMVTTARDMATLGLALRRDHGRYYGYWRQTEMDLGDRTIAGHNKTLGSIPGADGIKTGYTRASGFNLATSVQWRGRSIVAVILGEDKAAIRDARMRSLVSQTLPKAKGG